MMSSLDIALGNAIRTARKRNCMTIEMLAKRINKSNAYISKIENGIISIELDVLHQISTVINEPVLELLKKSEYIPDHQNYHYTVLEKQFISFIEMINSNMHYNIDIYKISRKDMEQSLWYLDGVVELLNKKYPGKEV